MKKILILLLVLALALSFMACGKSKDGQDKTNTTAKDNTTKSSEPVKVELTDDIVKKYIATFPKFIATAKKEGIVFQQNQTMNQTKMSSDTIKNCISENGWKSQEYFYAVYTKMAKAISWVMVQDKMKNVPPAARKQMEAQMKASLGGFSDAEKEVLKNNSAELIKMYTSLGK